MVKIDCSIKYRLGFYRYHPIAPMKYLTMHIQLSFFDKAFRVHFETAHYLYLKST